MRGSRLSGGLVALLVILSMVLGACGSKTSAPAETKPETKTETKTETQAPAPKGPSGTFVLANVQDAKILNPILSTDVYSNYVNANVFDGMMAIDDKANLRPNLAKNWTISPDSLTITFDLRNDVKWHDGKPFTAKDVAFTFHAIMHPDYTGPRRTNFSDVAGVKEMDEKVKAIAKDATDRDAQVQKIWEEFKQTGGFQAKGDFSFEVKLAKVFAPIMVNLSIGIIPEHLLKGTEGKKMADSDFNQKPVGTGAMKFVDWKKGDSITLENNSDYKWGLFSKSFNMKTYIFKVVPDSNAAMAALENGEVDFAPIDADNWDKFTKIPDLQTFSYLGWGYQYLGYNFHNEILKEKEVRQALTLAVDRDSIVKDLKRGHAQVAHTHGAPGRWDFNENVKKWSYDQAAAKKLLDDAGWKVGAGGIREKNGKKLKLTFTFSSGDKYLEQLSTVVQQSWKEIGVDVTLEGIKFEAILDKLRQDTIQAFTLGWSLGVEPDAYAIWHTDGGFNWVIHYSNKEVDKLLEEGRAVLDTKKRAEIYAKMQSILAEEQPYTWIAFNNTLVGFSKRVKGPKPSAAGGTFWNMAEWEVSGK